MFVGHIFAASSDSLISHAPIAFTYEAVTIQKAVYDELFATVDVIRDFDGSIPSNWTFDTRLHALFEGDLFGGNVDFTEKMVESVRIKRRTDKDNKFKTIFEKKINQNADFAIELIDYLEPIGTIEYAYVPVISGGENDYIISKVESIFDHYFLCEKDKSYPMILDAAYNQTINYETSQVKPLGRKYPITIVNGNTGYKTGTMECLFLKLKDSDPATEDSYHYRTLIYSMLTNNQPKILKDSEGHIMIVNITGEISESDRQYLYNQSDGFYYVKSKFNWVECGDAYHVGDLYDNNLIDTDLDR